MEIIEHTDNRGFSVSFHGIPLKHFHIVSIKPGALRGNHIHDHNEVICVLGGMEIAKIILQDSEVVREFIVETEHKIIEISAGIKHSISNIGDKVFYLICFSTEELGSDID